MYYNFLSRNFLSLDFQIYRSIALRLEALNSDFFFLFWSYCTEAQMGADPEVMVY